jgi:hypothetical protein
MKLEEAWIFMLGIGGNHWQFVCNGFPAPVTKVQFLSLLLFWVFDRSSILLKKLEDNLQPLIMGKNRPAALAAMAKAFASGVMRRDKPREQR